MTPRRQRLRLFTRRRVGWSAGRLVDRSEANRRQLAIPTTDCHVCMCTLADKSIHVVLLPGRGEGGRCGLLRKYEQSVGQQTRFEKM
ncbi:unnamed protein product [Protopolystoma xenopodis]|uniref:Uncharacterized protein n=1 Tax=Protopolystoma xenopodis TaxID=117903 RepID=A0A3S5AWI8_9PLAT|nr:unnamed protein product [Protopolystoma xenopodis]